MKKGPFQRVLTSFFIYHIVFSVAAQFSNHQAITLSLRGLKGYLWSGEGI